MQRPKQKFIMKEQVMLKSQIVVSLCTYSLMANDQDTAWQWVSSGVYGQHL